MYRLKIVLFRYVLCEITRSSILLFSVWEAQSGKRNGWHPKILYPPKKMSVGILIIYQFIHGFWDLFSDKPKAWMSLLNNQSVCHRSVRPRNWPAVLIWMVLPGYQCDTASAFQTKYISVYLYIYIIIYIIKMLYI